MKRILILNADIVNEGKIHSGDLFIKNGRIEKIGTDLITQPADVVIDAEGKLLLCGMIDDQVHFREPGLTHKGDIFTESRAAVAGGITSFMDMPNTNPPTTTREKLNEKCKIAEKKSLANYAFYLGASSDNLEEIKMLDPMTACGIKVFMGASTGDMLVDDTRTLEKIFTNAPTLVATHCESTPMIQENEEKYRIEYGEDVPISCHPLVRSAEVCYQSSSLAVSIAEAHGTRLHMLHLSTEQEMELFSNNALDEKKITAEVCVHHLLFDQRDYEEKGSWIKCNPAIKTTQDRDALIRSVIENRIDVIGTDHAPHTLNEKKNTYFRTPSGIPMVQHALISLLELYHRGIFSLELIAEKISHAPARLFQMKDRGFIREGYWADLVLIDLGRPTHVNKENLRYHCGWSPFLGDTFTSSVMTTIVSGHVAFNKGRINDTATGERVIFNR